MTGVAQATDAGAQLVHYATVENTTGPVSVFHHPLTDSQPDAIVHVTQNFNPPGSPGTDNYSPLGVYYSGEGLWSIFNENDSAIPVGAAFNIWVPPPDASTFVHTATAGNINGHWTTIDNPMTNNNPGALLRVTQNFNPGGVGGTYNNSAIGVFFHSSLSQWTVLRQDLADMPVGASFNVSVLPDDPTIWIHQATAANTSSMWTSIDNPLTNDNPNAIVSVTLNQSPNQFVVGVYNAHPIGVYYIGSKWAIFNQDHANMPTGAFFNVSVPSRESALYVHSADPGNTENQWTLIDHPLVNGNRHAILFVTPNWNPGGAGGTVNDHASGVWYDPMVSNWAIFNQDGAEMPEGASFNIAIPPVDASTFVHGAYSENTASNWTKINNPVTNGNPDAIIHVTQNWNPSGVPGALHDHEIGVFYHTTASAWAIFNQDSVTMPTGLFFNVSIPAADAATFVHTADAGNIFGSSTVFHHPLTDGNAFAVVRVTQNWNPGGGSGFFNDHQIGVAYNGADWAIFNQDFAAMPEGASFNVTVAVPIVFSDGFESGDTTSWSVSVP